MGKWKSKIKNLKENESIWKFVDRVYEVLREKLVTLNTYMRKEIECKNIRI